MRHRFMSRSHTRARARYVVVPSLWIPNWIFESIDSCSTQRSHRKNPLALSAIVACLVAFFQNAVRLIFA